jgi:peptidoglycan-associated lipoprotein
MKNRWILLGLVALTAAALASGCRTKKPGINPNAPGYNEGDTVGFGTDQVIIGYDENGNPIYADSADGMMRLDGSPVGAGQFEPVYFEYDSPRLNPAEQTKIDMVVACLQQNPTYGVIVEGHCDERGSNEYNLALGERRALAVRAAIVSAGIDGTRVQTSSRGEESPSAMGHDESSWSLNRRAEFVFTQM